MTDKTISKIILSAATAMLLTACGGGDTNKGFADNPSTTTQNGSSSDNNANGADSDNNNGAGMDNNTSAGGSDDNNASAGGSDDNNASAGGSDDNNASDGSDDNEDRFTITNTTVSDKTTGLVWDINSSDAGACTGSKKVPTVSQLLTILDYSKNKPAFVDGFKIDTNDGDYKTSDGYDIDSRYGLIKNSNAASKTICVDTSNEKNPTRKNLTKDPDTNEITDPNTKLIWADSNSSLPVKTLEEADNYCKSYDGGMRLPTVAELNTIYDRKNKTTVEPFARPNQSGNGWFWTSEANAGNSTQNWVFGFGKASDTAWTGLASVRNKSKTAIVRCVTEE